jgi:integrase
MADRRASPGTRAPVTGAARRSSRAASSATAAVDAAAAARTSGIQWTTPAVAATVDRRVVVSPAQARTLLAAVRSLGDRGAHLEAFYDCLYYAALRPSEAVMLRDTDLHLPKKGWGRIDLAGSASRAGTAWTDHGTARQQHGLKHRAEHETRAILIPPELVRLLRADIRRYGTTPDGRIFQAARGGVIHYSAYSAVWAEVDGQHNRSHPCRPCLSVCSAAPEAGTHGRIADGADPRRRLERRKRWSAGHASSGASGL